MARTYTHTHIHAASKKLLRDYCATRLLSDRNKYTETIRQNPRCSYIPLIAAHDSYKIIFPLVFLPRITIPGPHSTISYRQQYRRALALFVPALLHSGFARSRKSPNYSSTENRRLRQTLLLRIYIRRAPLSSLLSSPILKPEPNHHSQRSVTLICRLSSCRHCVYDILSAATNSQP